MLRVCDGACGVRWDDRPNDSVIVTDGRMTTEGLSQMNSVNRGLVTSGQQRACHRWTTEGLSQMNM